MFAGATLRARMRDPRDRHEPRSRLVMVEQTTNLGGGRVWPLAKIEEVLAVARRVRPPHPPRRRPPAQRRRRLREPRRRPTPAASKPPGSTSPRASAPRSAPASPAPRDLIAEARRYKQMFGGSMRQAGIVAAGARYGLQHNVERLADDHANAKFLAEGLAEIHGVEIDPATVETNIVIFDVPDGAALHDKLTASAGRNQPARRPRPHAVTHLDVDRARRRNRPRPRSATRSRSAPSTLVALYATKVYRGLGEEAGADPVAGAGGGAGSEVVAAPDRGDVVGHFLFLEALLDGLELAGDVLVEGDEEEALVEVPGFVEAAVVVVGAAQDALVLGRRRARVGEPDVGARAGCACPSGRGRSAGPRTRRCRRAARR